MTKAWLSEESEWGFKHQVNHGNQVINWALSKEGGIKDVTELVEQVDGDIFGCCL